MVNTMNTAHNRRLHWAPQKTLLFSTRKTKSRSGQNAPSPVHPLGGFTLIELMIAAVISGILLSGLYQLFISQQRFYTLHHDTAEMQQTARGCEQMMVREIRMAGYTLSTVSIGSDVAGASFSDGQKEAIEEATAQSIAFTADVDCDGIMETVRYSLRGTSLVREMWRWDAEQGLWKTSGGRRSLSEHIDALHFSYGILADNDGLNNNQDDDGDFSVDEEGELLLIAQPNKEERQHVRIVCLTLTAKAPRPDRLYRNPFHGDHYRRMTFSSTIQPRNLGL
jgi:prepilin-type N-terminal cleavage/methylation domain-containing protein